MSAALRADRLSLTMAGRRVLESVSFAVEEGAFVGVLGPNGAGKTTLMRAVLGLVPVAGGRLEVLGAPVRRGNPRIGYLPQMRAALGVLPLDGRDFVASVVDGQRWGLAWSTRRRARAVDQALDAVGARELARRPLSEMSGGERQRLLLAQALIGEPRLLLLDEPLISLDMHRQNEIIALVERLRRELGLTVLFSAHEVNPLLGAMTQVLYLGSGAAALGAVNEVITGPVLSRLYGTDIDVLRLKGRIFVMAGGHDLEHDEHRHDVAV